MSDHFSTIKLYDEDPRTAAFAAVVLSCRKTEEEGVYGLVLDRTCFFPEGGGQKSDTGALFPADGEDTAFSLRVTDVQIREGEIVHYVRALPAAGGEASEAAAGALIERFREGGKVRGEIDFDRRLDFMVQHTGEHIVSGIVCHAFGYDNVGFRLSEDHVTMDYSGPLTPADIDKIEEEANRAVRKNLPVIVTFLTEEEQKTLSYRSKKEILDEPLRLVEIPGIDRCACCAPHVAHTGEVGCIKIVRLQNWKGGVRLSIACGARALKLFREEHDMIRHLAGRLSTSRENIPDRFERLREENGALKKELRELKKRFHLTDPESAGRVQA